MVKSFEPFLGQAELLHGVASFEKLSNSLRQIIWFIDLSHLVMFSPFIKKSVKNTFPQLFLTHLCRDKV